MALAVPPQHLLGSLPLLEAAPATTHTLEESVADSIMICDTLLIPYMACLCKTIAEPGLLFLLVSSHFYSSNAVLTQKNSSCLQSNSPNSNKHRVMTRVRAILILTAMSREIKQCSWRICASHLTPSHVASLDHSKWLIHISIFLSTPSPIPQFLL